MAQRLGCWTCKSEALSSSPALIEALPGQILTSDMAQKVAAAHKMKS